MEERQALTPYILDFRYLLTDLTRCRGLEYLETVLRYISRGADTLKPDELR